MKTTIEELCDEIPRAKAIEQQIKDLVTDCVFGGMPADDERVGKKVEVQINGMSTEEKLGPPHLYTAENGDSDWVGVFINEVVIDCRITLRDVVQTTKDGDS